MIPDLSFNKELSLTTIADALVDDKYFLYFEFPKKVIVDSIPFCISETPEIIIFLLPRASPFTSFAKSNNVFNLYLLINCHPVDCIFLIHITHHL